MLAKGISFLTSAEIETCFTYSKRLKRDLTRIMPKHCIETLWTESSYHVELGRLVRAAVEQRCRYLVWKNAQATFWYFECGYSHVHYIWFQMAQCCNLFPTSATFFQSEGKYWLHLLGYALVSDAMAKINSRLQTALLHDTVTRGLRRRQAMCSASLA